MTTMEEAEDATRFGRDVSGSFPNEVACCLARFYVTITSTTDGSLVGKNAVIGRFAHHVL